MTDSPCDVLFVAVKEHLEVWLLPRSALPPRRLLADRASLFSRCPVLCRLQAGGCRFLVQVEDVEELEPGAGSEATVLHWESLLCQSLLAAAQGLQDRVRRLQEQMLELVAGKPCGADIPGEVRALLAELPSGSVDELEAAKLSALAEAVAHSSGRDALVRTVALVAGLEEISAPYQSSAQSLPDCELLHSALSTAEPPFESYLSASPAPDAELASSSVSCAPCQTEMPTLSVIMDGSPDANDSIFASQLLGAGATGVRIREAEMSRLSEDSGSRCGMSEASSPAAQPEARRGDKDTVKKAQDWLKSRGISPASVSTRHVSPSHSSLCSRPSTGDLRQREPSDPDIAVDLRGHSGSPSWPSTPKMEPDPCSVSASEIRRHLVSAGLTSGTPKDRSSRYSPSSGRPPVMQLSFGSYGPDRTPDSCSSSSARPMRRSYSASSMARSDDSQSLCKAMGTRRREAEEGRLRARARSVSSPSDAVARAQQRVRSNAKRWPNAHDEKNAVPSVRLDLFKRRDARIQKFLERQEELGNTTEMPSRDESMLRRIAHDADTSEECTTFSTRLDPHVGYDADLSFLEAETEAWTEELYVPLPPPRPSPAPESDR